MTVLVLGVTTADELTDHDRLIVLLGGDITDTAVISVFNTGHGRVQVTTKHEFLWFDEKEYVTVLREKS